MKRFVRAFVEGIWGELADRLVEGAVFVAGVFYLVVQSDFSSSKLIESRWQAFTVGVWAISALMVWHGFRSAFRVEKDVREENEHRRKPQYSKIVSPRGDSLELEPTRDVSLSLVRTALYGIAVCLTCIGVGASYLSWAKTSSIAANQPTGSPAINGLQRSRLEVTNIVGVPAQNKNTRKTGFFFNVFYANKGAIAATSMTHRTVIVTADHLLSSEEKERYEKQAATIPLGKSDSGEEIGPGMPPYRYFSVPENDSEIGQLGPSAEAVLDGKKRIYLFVVMKYRDIKSPSTQIRVTEFCGWFLGTFDMWHNCGNRIHSESSDP